jgi:hypothetical protein
VNSLQLSSAKATPGEKAVFWTTAPRSATPNIGASLSRRDHQEGSGCSPGLRTFSTLIRYPQITLGAKLPAAAR